jgi:DNA-binding transcriptional ArsR family regulator
VSNGADATATIFAALADSSRRAVLDAISRHGRVSASALARELTISRQAIAKHLDLLERAGLVTSTRSGREILFELRPEPLSEAARWLRERAATWDRRLAALKRAAERESR